MKRARRRWQPSIASETSRRAFVDEVYAGLAAGRDQFAATVSLFLDPYQIVEDWPEPLPDTRHSHEGWTGGSMDSAARRSMEVTMARRARRESNDHDVALRRDGDAPYQIWGRDLE